ncbi:hypothetical protein ACP8HI_05160 [Paenibacillus sp. FA6]|uniref:hypothetical protein n=1 Tax=Paenibacillus sp. FA6 TaxID=3413029 RepID=UPI003F6563F8
MRKKSTLIMMIMMVVFLPFITSVSAVGYEPIQVKQDTITAYITMLEHKEGQLFIEADAIQWYEGEVASKVFLEREQETGDLDGPPDGYYILNDSEELATYKVSDNVEVLMQIYDRDGTYEGMDIIWNESITLNKFQSLFENNEFMDLSQFPYHLTIEDGVVVRIVQQYIP